MKIGIHNRENSFSERWIEYCKKNEIPFKIVNCYGSDILEQLADCDVLMWHHNQTNYKDMLFAKSLLFSLEQSGKIVFPNFRTGWHFDDKVAQKYLLESIDAPLVPSYVFYDKESAIQWCKSTTFPKVFKLKGGSGSSNVKLVKSLVEARKLINKSFGRGFSQFNGVGHFKERLRRYKQGKDSLLIVIKALGRIFIPTQYALMGGREIGYAYFQDFIPDNSYDIRVIIVGEKAFAIKRFTRENDFRASGSGNIKYDRAEIDIECIASAFRVNSILKAQSIAFDYVFDEKRCPLIVEISYGYAVKAYDPCPGYWNKDMEWFPGSFRPQDWMIENIIAEFNNED